MEIFVYRIIAIALFSTLTLIRFFFKLKTHTISESLLPLSEGTLLLAVRLIFGIPLTIGSLLYTFYPQAMTWSQIQLPAWARLTGCVLGIAALTLLTAAHMALGTNFSTTADVHPGSRLVKEGPYHFLQHPIYSSYCLFFGGIFLVTASWFLGTAGLVIILSLMTIRLKRETAALNACFGEEYREYARCTGRFFPRTCPKPASLPSPDIAREA